MRSLYCGDSCLLYTSEHSIQMVKSGVIRNHKLGNSAREHSGETEEKESSIFIDFLSTRNCDLMINLRGNNNV